MVALATLQQAMRACVPPYRREHVELNDRALAAGWEAVSQATAPAWREGAVA
jgi:hypothetical protein